MTDIVARERLSALQSTRYDVLVFLAVFVGGECLYFTLRMLNVTPAGQTVSIVAVMIAYAIAVTRVPKLRVRFDQAGDNAYYLGLLFTLTSMAFALYTFSTTRGSGAEHIISNFGIAIATTIVGIFLRVLLQQMRVDPADVESMTRIELAEASRRMKVTLDAVSGDLGLFHDEVRQRMSDVMLALTSDYTKFMTDLTDEVGGATRQLLERTQQAQQDVLTRTAGVTEKLDAAANSAYAAIEKLRAVEPPPLKLASRLEKVCVSLEGLASPIQSITLAMEQSGRASAAAIAQMATVREEMAALAKEGRQQQNESLEHIRQAARDFRGTLVAAGQSLQREKRVFQDLEAQVAASTGQVERAHQAANEVLKTLTLATQQMTAVVTTASSPARGDV